MSGRSVLTRRQLLRAGSCSLVALAGCSGGQPRVLPGESTTTERPTPEQHWRQSLDGVPGWLRTGPDRTSLYGANDNGGVFAYTLDGSRRWYIDREVGIQAVTDERLLLEETSSAFTIDARTGEIGWSFPGDPHEVIDSATMTEDRAYLLTTKQGTSHTTVDDEFVRLTALDASDGTVIWDRSLEPGPDKRNWGVSTAGETVVVTWDGGEVRGYDRSGSERWTSAVTLPDVDGESDDPEFVDVGMTAPVAGNGTVYVGAGDDFVSTVVALEPDSGALRWQVPGYEGVAAVGDERVYCYRDGGHVASKYAALDVESGDVVWDRAVSRHRLRDRAAIADGVVYVTMDTSDEDADSVSLRALDAATGDRLAKVDLSEERITPPVVAGDRVFVGYGSHYAGEGRPSRGGLRALPGIHAGGTWTETGESGDAPESRVEKWLDQV